MRANRSSCAMARPRRQDLCDQRAKIWLLDLLKPSAPVLRGVSPGIRACAHECPDRFAVTKVDRSHRDDEIDDARNLAPDALAFYLESVLGTTVIVGDGFQRADQDDV